jgi:murein L,D-transpeptidase YcbB/YkuD
MTQTVIFSGHLQYVVFSPYWYIPPSIIQKEIKPGMARNPNYLSNHHMEWNGGNVRQKPGNTNSLGLVKFIFPNSYNIYLHDTPSKPLFDEDNRAFSHGCIRVAQPRALALQILKQIPAWTPEKIDAAMHAGTEKTVLLKKKIPVYIGYFTAFVNSKGKLNFREDVYNRDQRLLNFLMNGKQ